MNSSKRVSLIIILFVFLTGTFFVGFRFGALSVSPKDQVATVYNKDSENIIEGVDFEPFWRVWHILDEKYAGTASSSAEENQKRVWGAIEGMTGALGDPYTVFFPPKESELFKSEISGNFEGVGMEVGVKEGKLVVVAPLKDTPAEKSGVRPGDIIAKIDNKDSIHLSTDEAVKLIRGKSGTVVKLTLIREGIEKPFEISITRTTINVPIVKTETKGDVFVISLYSFNANSASLFRGALRDFVKSGKDRLILDLRGNPGGYLDAAVDMASWFLPSGKIIVQEDFGNKEREDYAYRSKGYDIFTDRLKMIILVDGGSASASEILAGALSEHGIAKIVGTKTFGKGSVQEFLPITENTSLKVTIANWLTPSGKSISKEGIVPDYVVDRTAKDVKENKDPQLQKALELLSK